MEFNVIVLLGSLLLLYPLGRSLDKMNLYSYGRAVTVVMFLAGMAAIFSPLIGMALTLVGVILYYMVKL